MRKRVAVPVCALTLLAMSTPLAGAERLPESHKPFKYKKRYVECRKALGFKPKPHRGSFRHAKRCRSLWRWKATKSTALAIKLVWPKAQHDNAMRVTACEGGPQRKINAIGDGGHSRSSWQINDLYWTYNHDRALNDAVYASELALSIWRRGGWGMWTCARLLGVR